jgi:hypothetical protein
MDYSATFYGPNKAGLIPLTQTSMYMFITTTEPGNPWMPDDRLHELMRERLQGHTGFVVQLRSPHSESAEVVYLAGDDPLPPQHRGRVLLIGGCGARHRAASCTRCGDGG